MACIVTAFAPTLINDQIRPAKTSFTPTTKTVVLGSAVSGITASEWDYMSHAIYLTGANIGDQLTTDHNCLLTQMEAESIEGKDPGGAIVTFTYVGYDFYGSNIFGYGGFTSGKRLSYSYNGITSQEQTNYAYDDPTTPLKVYYWPDKANVGDFTAQTAKQGATIPVLKPYTQKTVKFFYKTTSTPDVGLNGLMSNVGYTNSVTWDYGDQDTWLCTGVTVTPVGLPQQVLVECSFYYRPETWTQWAFYQDPDTGQSPEGALKYLLDPEQFTNSNGCAGFMPYDNVNFLTEFGFG